MNSLCKHIWWTVKPVRCGEASLHRIVRCCQECLANMKTAKLRAFMERNNIVLMKTCGCGTEHVLHWQLPTTVLQTWCGLTGARAPGAGCR